MLTYLFTYLLIYTLSRFIARKYSAMPYRPAGCNVQSGPKTTRTCLNIGNLGIPVANGGPRNECDMSKLGKCYIKRVICIAKHLNIFAGFA